MEYLLSTLLLALNLLNYERPLNSILFFFVGLALFCALFYVCNKKTGSYLCACLMMFCHTWQISWINVFGKSSAELQLPWFYIVGVLVVGWALFNIRKLVANKVNSVILAIFACTFILFVYPLFLSKSLSEGLKEFVMIGFFLVLTFIALLAANSIPSEKRRYYVNSFIFVTVLCSVLLVFQFLYYSATGNTIFKISLGQYYGFAMTSSKLLMEDLSCATIMLGCGVFYMLERLSKKNWLLYGSFILVTVIGLAFTTRRTSVISLVAMLVFYVILHYKGALKKSVMIVIIAGIITVMISYLLLARPVDDISQMLYENGRIEYYINSLLLFLKNPLGIGYDNVYLAQAVGGVIPHNTFLRWLTMCGFPYTVCMAILLVYIIVKAYRKHMTTEMWILLYSLLASQFIPDILNARFFVIPCMTVFLMRTAAPIETKQNAINVKFSLEDSI